jgi:hypothetical protein
MFKGNRFYRVLGAVYLSVLLTLTFALNKGVYWITLNLDTAKMVLSTLMGVSGSIIGFIVIYLSLALEGMKRNYGKQAVDLFRKDASVWLLCWVFCFILIVALAALLFSDRRGVFPLWLFNAACWSFAAGIAIIVPYGQAILLKTDSTEHIAGMITGLKGTDFRELPDSAKRIGAMYWVISEDPKNPVDKVSNIIFHHISEGNSKLATYFLIDFFRQIEQIGKVGIVDLNRRMLTRYLDVLMLAFDFTKTRGDEMVVTTILACLKSCSSLITTWKAGAELIEKQFEGIGNIIKFMLEAGREKMADDAFWAYYHMAKTQLGNIPPANQIWTQDEDGDLIVIDSLEAWGLEHKFDAIDKAMTYDLRNLIERSFLSKNGYIIQNSVGMSRVFLEMLILENGIERQPKLLIGRSLAYGTADLVKRYISETDRHIGGFLALYLPTSSLMHFLEENSDLSEVVFRYFIDVFGHLVDNQRIIKEDLDYAGGVGRLIIAHSAKIKAADQYLTSLLEIQSRAMIGMGNQLMQQKLSKTRKEEMEDMLSGIKTDLHSFVRYSREKAPENEVLKLLVESFQPK